jgi:hypothetical protein
MLAQETHNGEIEGPLFLRFLPACTLRVLLSASGCILRAEDGGQDRYPFSRYHAGPSTERRQTQGGDPVVLILSTSTSTSTSQQVGIWYGGHTFTHFCSEASRTGPGIAQTLGLQRYPTLFAPPESFPSLCYHHPIACYAYSGATSTSTGTAPLARWPMPCAHPPSAGCRATAQKAFARAHVIVSN